MRRLLPVLLALLLPLWIGACGGGTTEDTAPQDMDTEAATEAAPTDTAEDDTTDTAAEGDDDGAQGDPEAGAEIFASAGCGNCHVYEPAGSTGTVGPNLDESDVEFADAEQQIRQGGGGMPAYEGQLSDEEIANVAAFVTEDSR